MDVRTYCSVSSQAAGMSIMVINTLVVDRKFNTKNRYCKYTIQLQIQGNVHDSSLWNYKHALLSTRCCYQYWVSSYSTVLCTIWVFLIVQGSASYGYSSHFHHKQKDNKLKDFSKREIYLHIHMHIHTESVSKEGTHFILSNWLLFSLLKKPLLRFSNLV